MGRPRQFDPDAVVRDAMDVFWRKGYEATSVDDLVAATGLGRQSLYNAFGDKRALYGTALQAYCDRAVAQLDEALGGDDPALDRLRGTLTSLVESAIEDPDRRGCFAVNAGVECADEGARATVATQLARLTQEYAGCLDQARLAGDLPEGRHPRALAHFVVTLASGLQAVARAHPDPALLRDSLAVALAVLDTRAAPGTAPPGIPTSETPPAGTLTPDPAAADPPRPDAAATA